MHKEMYQYEWSTIALASNNPVVNSFSTFCCCCQRHGPPGTRKISFIQYLETTVLMQDEEVIDAILTFLSVRSTKARDSDNACYIPVTFALCG